MKQSFLQSMLKAEQISKESSVISDIARLHSPMTTLEDKNKRKKEDFAIAQELHKKQEEIENILKKKRDEEQIKRLEFEEERIKEENEKLKLAAEEKRKREEEDELIQLRMDQIIQEEQQRRIAYLEEQGISGKMEADNSSGKENKEIEIENQRLRDEEIMIELGRKEAQKEFQEKINSKFPTSPPPVPAPPAVAKVFNEKTPNFINNDIKSVETPEEMKKTNFTNVPSVEEGPAVSNKSIEEEICIENIRPMQVFRGLEQQKQPRDVNGVDLVKTANKSLQKQKLSSDASFYKTGAAGQKHFSLSRCWSNVQTGHVKNKATSYLKPGSDSPAVTAKSPVVKVILNTINS